MITKQQLQTMSDFEVNKALCTILGKDVSGVDEQRNMMTGAVTEYCDKYSAVMPLAFEHHLTMHYVDNGDEHKWFVTKPYSPEHCHDANPLRAIACCLILVLQEKQK